MNCLLAPVPALLLPDALELAAKGRIVAFGSNSFEVLDRLKKSGAEGALPVHIVVSQNGFDLKKAGHSKPHVRSVQFRGTLAAITPAERGKHPDQTKRPQAASDGDSPAGLFWEVEGLHEITPPLTLQNFSNAAGKAWQTIPEGPVPAHLGNSQE
jgi:hypothetical protein